MVSSSSLKLIASIIIVLVVDCCCLADDSEVLVAFKQFMGKYGKSYESDAEFTSRLKIFKENTNFIISHNSNPHRTYDVKINSFGDLTTDEYVAKLPTPSASCFGGNEGLFVAPPATLDWRSTGNVPPVQNEGESGSPMYISVANQISSALSITVKQPPVPLSTEQMMDCYTKIQPAPWDLYAYVKTNGLETAADYKFNGSSKCNYKSSLAYASITGSGNVTTETAMLSAVYQYGPIISYFDAASQAFQFYSSGIFNPADCNKKQVDHVLLIVGYGVENNTDYWIAQNEWGTEWGMDGYVYILRGKDTCGIATCSSYVTGAHLVQHN